MSLQREMETQGVWLFRWRSYLPFAFVPLLVCVIADTKHDGTHWFSDTVWPIVCLAVSLLGLAVRVHCVGHAAENTSGRNTKEQIADDLNSTGLYSVLRHPLYLGNFLIAVGIIAQPNCWWLIGLFTLAFWVYYERIMFAEERFLERKFGSRFTSWAERTPAMIPRFRQWIEPTATMNWTKVACQEAAAVAVISIGFTAVEMGEHYATGSIATLEVWWVAFALISTATYFGLRYFKHWERQHRPCDDAAKQGGLRFDGGDGRMLISDSVYVRQALQSAV